MTKRKYTQEELKIRRIEIGKKLGQWRRDNPHSKEEKEGIGKRSKAFHASLSDEDKLRRSKLHSESAKKQMLDPAARKNISNHMKTRMANRGGKKVYEMTDEIREKIASKQRGIKKKYMLNPDALLSWRENHTRKWFLISPRGIHYEFDGLQLFIEQHRELFSEHDLFRYEKSNTFRICSSLFGLSPRRKKVTLVSHGWQWDLEAELAHFKKTQTGRFD